MLLTSFHFDQLPNPRVLGTIVLPTEIKEKDKMITHQQKLPFFKRIVMNIQIWKLWHDLAKESDELAILIVNSITP